MAYEMFIDHIACNIESRVPKKYPMLKIFGMALVSVDKIQVKGCPLQEECPSMAKS